MPYSRIPRFLGFALLVMVITVGIIKVVTYSVEKRQCHGQCKFGDAQCATRCQKDHFCPAEPR
jgi:hypothetical protein